MHHEEGNARCRILQERIQALSHHALDRRWQDLVEAHPVSSHRKSTGLSWLFGYTRGWSDRACLERLVSRGGEAHVALRRLFDQRRRRHHLERTKAFRQEQEREGRKRH